MLFEGLVCRRKAAAASHREAIQVAKRQPNSDVVALLRRVAVAKDDEMLLDVSVLGDPRGRQSRYDIIAMVSVDPRSVWFAASLACHQLYLTQLWQLFSDIVSVGHDDDGQAVLLASRRALDQEPFHVVCQHRARQVLASSARPGGARHADAHSVVLRLKAHLGMARAQERPCMANA